MAKKRRQFYVPNTDFWRWQQLTDTFLKVQLERVQRSYNETEGALSVLDERVDALGEIAKQWANSRVYDLRGIVEREARDIAIERQRILRIQERIVQELDRIKSELRARKTNSDRKLPA